MARQTVYKLDRKIEIQYDAAANDNSTTRSTPKYQKLCTAYASKKVLSGQLLYNVSAENTETDSLFTIHYRNPDTLLSAKRIVDGVHVYSITASPADPHGDRMWLQIKAKEVLQNGSGIQA